MFRYQNIQHIFCLCNILVVSIAVIECSEKRSFPDFLLNEKDEDPPKNLENKFDLLKTPTRNTTPPKKQRTEITFHQNTFSISNNRIIYETATSDPNRPGFTTFKTTQKKREDSPKKTTPRFNFSKINTKEKCQKKVSKLTQGENTQVCIQCDYCNHTENNPFLLAAYNIIAHRKTGHSVCGCNKEHQTPKDAYDCTFCQQHYYSK